MNSRIVLIVVPVLIFLSSSCGHDNDEPTPDAVVNIEGKEYPIVVVGTQTWTAVNYDGQGGVPYDGNSPKPEYGRYYSKAELASITLPEGWRIPNQEDYKTLAQFYGITLPSNGTQTEEIKSLISKTNWNHVAGTNASGFNAYPAGYVFGASPPMDGDIAEFWTADGITVSIQEAGADLTSLRLILYQSDNGPDYKFNVRFVKN
jgi:uncharacterized protein (TIGR02145 family)